MSPDTLVCGQTFMAGTVCTLTPGHAGSHAPICQDCDKDWYLQECTCHPFCPECGATIQEPSAPYCDDCCCDGQDPVTDYWCQLENEHVGACEFADFIWPPRDDAPPTEAELAEVYKSLGVTCTNCHEPLVWHAGNGGQWLGANPPRDWATCHGSVIGPKHTTMQ